MDFRTVVTISTLLLMTADGAALQHDTTPLSTQSTRDRTNSSVPSAAPAATASRTPDPSVPVLGLLAVSWTRKCEGQVILHHPSASSPHVCRDSEAAVENLLTNVCENRKGCRDTPRWRKDRGLQGGWHISEGGAVRRSSCETLTVQCTAESVEVLPDVQGQLRAYKVVTALLCCVLLVLLLIRFTKPTVKALQKRFSDRRQNRWVGPTQSHSVSYHRGKNAVQNNEEDKTLSYSALDRLAISDSREPSSNRNSDYNY